MTLKADFRLAAYEIVSQLGAGGMGEVYRAKDTKLGRDVALKILPASFTNDPERVARFRREAQVLASLNHPHIAQIYGLEEVDDTQFLVLELVDGESLDKRIARGPIPVDEALGIAKQIAEALEAAHEKGIIHRDLKPANIALTNDGQVKVLDFGLAKAVETTGGSVDAMNSPTITSPAMMTGAGVILGTAAYMSPEQAKGRAADKRSDIWAFGCVLYEMLTGKRPFDGDDVSDTLASVLRGEPDWSALPAGISPRIRQLLRHCLQKDRGLRVGDISIARYVIDESRTHNPLDGGATIGQTHRGWNSRRAAGLVAAGVLGATLSSGSLWLTKRPTTPRVTRTTITPTGPTALAINGNDRDLAVTPDGSRVVYVGNTGTQLFVRALDTLEPIPILTGTGLRAPFVSANGLWVGFADSNSTLKKVAITGGPAIEVTRLGAAPRGATWTPDDSIIFATNNGALGLQRVSASGGTPVVLTRPDHSRGEIGHLWPEILPGGRAVLFTISAQGGQEAASIAVLDLQTGTTKVILRGGSHAQYLASGYLVFGAAGTLRAVPFDLTQQTVRGTPVPVVPRIVMSNFGAFEFALASDGTLVYVDAPATSPVGRTLMWVDRNGKEEPVGAPSRGYNYPSLSSDGTRIAVSAGDQEQDVWIWDLQHGPPLARLTVDPSQDVTPIWTSDGRIIFGSDRLGGIRNLWWQAADGTDTPERLMSSTNSQTPTGLTPNGSDVLVSVLTPDRGFDIMRLPLRGDRRLIPVVQTSANERSGVVSPDGHWLAYQSDRSGSPEIYVRPYPTTDPNSEAGARQVSLAGGTRPLWARGGRELFYVTPDLTLMSVRVEATPTVWHNGAPTKLIDVRSANIGTPWRSYDVSPDGQRFLMVRAAGQDQGSAAPSVIVVQHWDEDLKANVTMK
jgi:serine/threonine-protein kinase